MNLESLRFSNNIKSLPEVRVVHLNRKLDYPQNATAEFKLWLEDPLYLVFENGEDLEFHKASKRGNAIYRYQLKKKLKQETSFMKGKNFENLVLHKGKTHVLFVTLTWNTNRFFGNRKRSWLSIMGLFENFMKRFRRKFGKAWVLRALESTKKAFPHVHLLLITEKEFKAFKKGKDWRIREKNQIASLWSDFVDIKVPINSKATRIYIFKDLIKAFNRKSINRDPKDWLTLSMNWLFRKRSYSISNSKMLKKFDLKALSLTHTFQYSIRSQIGENEAKGKEFLGLTIVKSKRGNKPPPNFFKIKHINQIPPRLIHNLIKFRNEIIE